jgi:biotin carboxyl carrier protein
VWLKKRYILNYNDKQHSAVVARAGRDTQIQIDEAPATTVNFRTVLGGRALSLHLDGRLHLVHLTGTDAKGGMTATVDGRPVSLTVMDELRAQALQSLQATAGSGVIAADIPGLVCEIKVQVGQKVHQGEPVIVVEAMKMQNELVAAVSGTVSEIPVEPGQTVNPGDRLIVIEPEPGG